MFGGAIEGVVHLAVWANGFDIHLVGGPAFDYISKGSQTFSSGPGIGGGVGPGFSWYFARGKVSGAMTLDLPIRIIYFWQQRLSTGGTAVFSVPMRLGATVGF